jgi:hypothetical protein
MNVNSTTTYSKIDAIDVDGDGVVDMLTPNGWIKGYIGTAPSNTVRPFWRDCPITESYCDKNPRRTAVTTFGGGSGASMSIAIPTSSGRVDGTRVPTAARGGGSGLPIQLGSALSVARNRVVYDLHDVNGDGLPDRVRRDKGTGKVWVQLNLGGKLGIEEPFGGTEWVLDGATATPDDFQEGGGVDEQDDVDQQNDGEERPGHRSLNNLSHSTTLTKTSNLGFVIPGIDVGFDIEFSSTGTRTITDFSDINGDGLPDLLLKKDGLPIQVQLNTGSGFAEQFEWSTPPWPQNATLSSPIVPTLFGGFLAPPPLYCEDSNLDNTFFFACAERKMGLLGNCTGSP